MRFMKRVYPLLSVIVFLLTACNVREEQHIQGYALGTYYSITYVSTKEDGDLQRQVDSVLREINDTYSIFSEKSLVSRVNRNEAVRFTADFIGLTKEALKVSAATAGAFDITAGPLIKQWGFAKDAGGEVDSATLDSIREFVGYQKLALTSDGIQKSDNRIQLDYNAIAKGYAVDKVSWLLLGKGYSDFVVDIGGEIITHGKKDGAKQPWHIGIQVPTQTKDGVIDADYVFAIPQDARDGLAMATSGNYRNYIEKDGERHSHIINPATGHSEQSDLLSVTVVISGNDNTQIRNARCARADAYATAFMVMGRKRGMEFLNHGKGLPTVAAHFIYYADGRYKYEQTENFPKAESR